MYKIRLYAKFAVKRMEKIFKLGARIHDILFEGAHLTERLKETGVEVVQLTLPKFVSWSESPQNYSLEKLKALKTAFDEAGVEIKVLSCYINPLAADVEKEQAVFRKFVDYCSVLGIGIVGTETGSAVSDLKDYKLNLTEENYQKAKNCLKPLAEYAAEKGVTVGIETVSYFPICSAERFNRLESDLKPAEIYSIFDATNLLNAENYTRQREITEEFIKTHAKKIKVVHLKDFVLQNGIFTETALFGGGLDIKFVLEKLAEYGVKADIIVECARSAEEFKEIKNKLLKIISEI